MKKKFFLLNIIFLLVFTSLIFSVDTTFITPSTIIQKDLATEINSLKSTDNFAYHIELSESQINKNNQKSLVSQLQEHSKTSQKPIVDYLKSQNIKFEAHYIVNMISVHLNRKTLKEIITNFSNIKTIYKQEKVDSASLKQTTNGSLTSPVDSTSEVAWNIKRINADKVWEEGSTGDGVLVGILDTAVDVNHPSIRRKFKGYDANTDTIVFKNDNFFDAINGKSEVTADMDRTHGTHVMGTILGSDKDALGNEINKIGVAPNAKFITARILDEKEKNLTDDVFIRAGEWMLAPGGNEANAPKVINNSWGGGKVSRWFEGIVKRWKQAGILPVFAAGNQQYGEPAPGPGSISVPALYADSFAVGATSPSDTLAYFSKKGPSPYAQNQIKPEVSAPGMVIRSAWPDGKYSYQQGTSMACPHVVGLAALLLSKKSNLTVSELIELITSTATPKEVNNITPNYDYGYGIINAKLAFDKLVTGKDTKRLKINLEGISEAYISINNTISQKVTKEQPFINYLAGTHPGKVTLEGYNTLETTFDFDKTEQTIALEKTNTSSINLRVNTTNYNVILIDKNQNLENYYSLENNFKIENKLVGKYKIIISKPGYANFETECNLENGNNEITAHLNQFDTTMPEITEVFNHNNSFTNTNESKHFHIGNTTNEQSFGYQGCATLFENNTPITLTSVRVKLFKSGLSIFQGSKLKLSIKTIDQYQRYNTILHQVTYNVIGGAINNLDLTRYNLKVTSNYLVIIEEYDRNEKGVVVCVDDNNTLSQKSFAYIGHNLYDFHFDKNLTINTKGGDLGINVISHTDAQTTTSQSDIIVNKVYQNETVSGTTSAEHHKLLLYFRTFSLLLDLKNNQNFSQVLYFDSLPNEEIIIIDITPIGKFLKPIYKKILFNRLNINDTISKINSLVNSSTIPNTSQLIQDALNYLNTLTNTAEEDINVAEVQQKLNQLQADIISSFLTEDGRRNKLKSLLDKSLELTNNTVYNASGFDVSIFDYFISDKYEFEGFLNTYQTIKQKYQDYTLSSEQITSYTNYLDKEINKFLKLRHYGKKSPMRNDLIDYYETHKTLFTDEYFLEVNSYKNKCWLLINQIHSGEVLIDTAKQTFTSYNAEFVASFISSHKIRNTLLQQLKETISLLSPLQQATDSNQIIFDELFFKGDNKNEFIDKFKGLIDKLTDKDTILDTEIRLNIISSLTTDTIALLEEHLAKGTKETENTAKWKKELQTYHNNHNYFTNKYQANKNNFLTNSAKELISSQIKDLSLTEKQKQIKDENPDLILEKNNSFLSFDNELNKTIIYIDDEDINLVTDTFAQATMSNQYKTTSIPTNNNKQQKEKKIKLEERRLVFITKKDDETTQF